MTWEPKGFMLVQIKEQTVLLRFDDREDWTHLFQWLQEVNAKPFAQTLGEKMTTEIGVSILDAVSQERSSGKQITPVDVYKTDDIPVCARHRTPMKKSEKDPGGYYCNRKDGSEYCRNHVTSKGKVVNEK
jgi:hypothetical protein